jgi:hypothetical protein
MGWCSSAKGGEGRGRHRGRAVTRDVSVGTLSDLQGRKAHLSSFINRFFSLSSSRALTNRERRRTSYELSRAWHQRHDETNAQLDLLSMSSIN